MKIKFSRYLEAYKCKKCGTVFNKYLEGRFCVIDRFAFHLCCDYCGAPGRDLIKVIGKWKFQEKKYGIWPFIFITRKELEFIEGVE